MKTFKVFSMTALAIMMAACSNETEELTQPKAQEPVHFTATINVGKATRALSDDGTTIQAAWAVGEKVAIIHGGKINQAEVTELDGTKAKVECTFTESTPADGDAIVLCYPYSSVKSATLPYFNPALFTTQTGTLEYISGSLDMRKADATIAVSGSKATLATDVDMSTSEIAIMKVTLKNGKSDFTPPSGALRVKVDGIIAAQLTGLATNEAYIALPPFSNKSFELYTFGGSPTKYYYYTNDDVTLAANTYYKSTVPMWAQVDLSTLTGAKADYEAQDGDMLTGNAAADTQVTVAGGATIMIKNTDFSALTGDSRAGIACNNDATILLEGSNTVRGCESGAGIFIASGKTLTILGNGLLDAAPQATNKFAAGIGGSDGRSCGNIIINGGTITATGGSYSAAIGGGMGANCGTITIAGGDVTAKVTHSEAVCAIGRSGAISGTPTCTSVTINTTITKLAIEDLNTGSSVFGRFINATNVLADSKNLTTLAPTLIGKELVEVDFTDPTDAAKMATAFGMAGFVSDYETTTHTWTITKKP